MSAHNILCTDSGSRFYIDSASDGTILLSISTPGAVRVVWTLHPEAAAQVGAALVALAGEHGGEG
ncbi:MAG: hypothetical protein QM741_18620 [Rudaea sp.]|uniref:hypothetical protein n=1 Tax=Rudaea sp. TaxID=2136325 RepID=UPI0039E2FEDA